VYCGERSVATCLWWGGAFQYDFVTNLLVSLTAKVVWKQVNIWRSYGQEYSVLFFLTHSIGQKSFSSSVTVGTQRHTHHADWLLWLAAKIGNLTPLRGLESAAGHALRIIAPPYQVARPLCAYVHAHLTPANQELPGVHAVCQIPGKHKSWLVWKWQNGCPPIESVPRRTRYGRTMTLNPSAGIVKWRHPCPGLSRWHFMECPCWLSPAVGRRYSSHTGSK